MAVEIPNGSVAFLDVDITVLNAAFFSTPDSVLSAIAGELIFDGLTIANKSVGLSGLLMPLTGEFSATLQILNQSGQELDDTDLTSQFSTAASDVGGLQVNSQAVTQVVGAPTGVNSGTGSQGNVTITASGAAKQTADTSTPSTAHQCGDPTWSGWSDPIQYIKCLTSGALTTFGILAIGLLIGVVLIVVAENKPRVSV